MACERLDCSALGQIGEALTTLSTRDPPLWGSRQWVPVLTAGTPCLRQAMLAGADLIKLGYVSRTNVRDCFHHVILGTQQYKPKEFAQHINLNMNNAW